MQYLAFLLQTAQPAAPAPGNTALSLLPIVLIGVIFYFLVFMPMQKQKKQQAQMLSSLEAGSEVVTTGGIVGTIVSITGEVMILRVKPDNVKLQVARSAVSGLVGGEKALTGDKK
jgi:preprotein translocase subunit YajC